MYIYPPKKMVSQLTPIQIFSLIENSGQFIVRIDEEKFTVRERKIFSNKVLLPLITGIVGVRKDHTIVDVMFELSKRDKVGFGVFIFSIFLLSLLLGFASLDVILAVMLICFDVVICAILGVLYVRNCNRAFKKLFASLNQ